MADLVLSFTCHNHNNNDPDEEFAEKQICSDCDILILY